MAKQLLADLRQFGLIPGLLDTLRKGAVGNFHHDRKAQSLFQFEQLLRLVLVQHHGSGCGHLVDPEQVRQVDLVGTAQDRVAVIDRDQSLILGLFGEAVGVVVDIGRGADKQAVVFRQSQVIPLADHLAIDTHLLARADKTLEGALVGGRHGFFRVAQNGEVVTGCFLFPALAPDLPAEDIERLGEVARLVFGQLFRRFRLETGDFPALAAAQGNLEDGAGEGFEQFFREVVIAAVLGSSEIAVQYHRLGRVGFLQGLVYRLAKIIDMYTIQRALAQVVQRAH